MLPLMSGTNRYVHTPTQNRNLEQEGKTRQTEGMSPYVAAVEYRSKDFGKWTANKATDVSNKQV